MSTSCAAASYWGLNRMGRMDWTRDIASNVETLRRIVAVLLALADIAERASGRCSAVRIVVLSLLRPGEAIAREFLADLSQCGAVPIRRVAIRAADGSASEAISLALSFRSLAGQLAAVVSAVAAAWLPVVAAVYHCAAGIGPRSSRRGRVAAIEPFDSS